MYFGNNICDGNWKKLCFDGELDVVMNSLDVKKCVKMKDNFDGVIFTVFIWIFICLFVSIVMNYLQLISDHFRVVFMEFLFTFCGVEFR